MRKVNKMSKLKNILINYTKSNSKEYILVLLIFIIGIFIGVMFINNCSAEKIDSITNYITSFIEKFSNIENIDKSKLIMNSIKSNFILAITVWLAGTTIIGMPVVQGLILFRGFCLGYTVSSVTFTLGIGKGLLFCILTLLLQNLLFIPAILTMGVSSIKLYRAIINDRRKENIKIEIIRHTIISLIMLGVLIVSSFIENEISINLLKFGIKYI